VLFSSHQLDLVERITESLVIIAGGAIRAAGSRAGLIAAYSTPRFRLVAPGDLAWVADVPGVSDVIVGVGDVTFGADDAGAQQILRRALGAGPVYEFAPVIPRLTELFKDVVVDAVSPDAPAKAVAA
jgi:ABC-2 type transport system ATP-binding protein